MKKVLEIFREDLISITSNWAAALMIIALMILPSLYAWFNIKASWDPYGNTKGIPIAVVNLDEGANLRGNLINIGSEIITSLKKNKSLGWVFVNDRDAKRGVERGTYFASITIPANFSAKITTILSDNPEKPELLYSVNEKVNAIAPKITSKGATSIKDQISKNFVKTANGVIFDIFNQLGIELQQNLPDIEKLKTMIFWLNDHLAEAERIINTADQDAEQAHTIVANMQKYIAEISGIIDDAKNLSGKISDFLDANQDAIVNLSPTIKQNLIYLEQAAAAVQQITDVLLTTTSPEDKSRALDEGISRLSALIKMEDQLVTLFGKLNDIGNTDKFNQEISQLNQQKSTALDLLTNLKMIQGQESPSQTLLVNTNQKAKETTAGLEQINNQYDSKIAPKFATVVQIAQKTPVKANEFFAKADETLPQISKVLADTSKGISIGKRDLALIKRDFPAVKGKISSLAAQIREFEKTENIQEIIDLLRNDVKKESDYFAEPVLLKENRLFPMPNYGSAMSPFFTSLALWVGATLLISLIPAEITDLPKGYHPNHVFLGRFLIFLIIALSQAIIVTMGDLFLLKTYVAAKLWFVLFALLISALFMLIIYTLVSIFGNLGKGLAIIFLVLQISGSGGTFPIQVMPVFFQRLNPYLPFTYAISLMREAAGGIVWDVVKRDLAVFAFFAIITLLFGLLLKGPIEKYGGGLKRKAQQSRLIH